MKGSGIETIDTRAYGHLPINTVWELFSDHEGYTTLEGVIEARPLKTRGKELTDATAWVVDVELEIGEKPWQTHQLEDHNSDAYSIQP